MKLQKKSMTKSRFIAEQIVLAVKQTESGIPVEKLCRRLCCTRLSSVSARRLLGDDSQKAPFCDNVLSPAFMERREKENTF